jgi:hypothetical protein
VIDDYSGSAGSKYSVGNFVKKLGVYLFNPDAFSVNVIKINAVRREGAGRFTGKPACPLED